MGKKKIIQSLDELARDIGIASADNNLERLQELEHCFEVAQTPGIFPLAPNVVLNPSQVRVQNVATESDSVLGLANALSRAKRRIIYHRKKWAGVQRPVIVSEGDSWFQYPVRLKDTIDVLMETYQIYSLGAAGDLLSDMAQHAEYMDAIASEDADILLLSGAGNDFAANGRMESFLKQYDDQMTVPDLINRSVWQNFLGEIRTTYHSMFNTVTTTYPNLLVLMHGYDYAVPERNGKWLGGPLANRGVPENLWKDVIKLLIDDLNIELSQIAESFGPNVNHVDCRGVVGNTSRSWFDEMHPKETGYTKVAQKFDEAIKAAMEAGGRTTVARSSLATELTIGPQRSTPKTGMPESVLQQFVGEIGRSPTGIAATKTPMSSQVDLREAIIQTGPANVGPKLKSAPKMESDRDPVEHVMDYCTRIRDVMDSVLTKGKLPARVPSETRPDVSQEDNDASLLRQSPCASLEVWHAHLRQDPESISSYNDFKIVRDEFDQKESHERVQTRLELMPETDLFLQERMIGKSNFEQINFLSRGDRAAKTVGRLSVFTEYDIPAGTGTGFLVGPGLILTNNHVIKNIQRASSGSYILFDYEYDADNRLKSSERFQLTNELFYTDTKLDFTFVSVESTGSRGSSILDYGMLTLIEESGKALKGEPVSIMQHPGGLPKQISIRDSIVVGRKGDFVYYYTDTDSGSSGSPVVNDQWFPVALHHRSVPDYYNPCQFVANRGIRISSIFKKLREAANLGDESAADIIRRLQQKPGNTSVGSASAGEPSSEALERSVEPFHELPYDNRQGYDDDFLGTRVRMPMVINPNAVAAPRIDTNRPKFLLKYEHFSLVMHKTRRLAIFTAANVDASRAKKRPESGKNYSRRGLSGLGENDREKWFIDPRIAKEHQLPDRFFEDDRKSFDKGHLTMRAEVAWGDSYEQVRRANGDTYHTTNCSPQVKEFNRAIFGFTGPWGKLEDFVLKQAKHEKLCVFAGPVLHEGDTAFRGKDHDGETFVKIPQSYWKVIVAETDDGVESFAFILEQDLSSTVFDPDELELTGEWVSRRTTVAEIEEKTGLLKFPEEFH